MKRSSIIFLTGWTLALLQPLSLAETYIPLDARAERAPSLIPELCAKPVWPKSSLRNEETGSVSVGAKIDVNGRVLEVNVLKSTGFPELDRAVATAISRCRFRPGTRDGVPVTSTFNITWVWTLE